MADKPYITWAKEAWDLFWDYVDLAPGEVAVWGYVEKDGTELFVSEVFLVPQEAHAAGVDFVKDGLPYAINKAIQDGKLDQLRFCAHSHGHYPVMWSRTDEQMIETLGSSGTPWLVSCVFNKKGETLGRLDVFADGGDFGKVQHTVDELRVSWTRTEDEHEKLVAEMEHFVTKPPKPAAKTTTYKPTSTKRDETKSLPAPTGNESALVTQAVQDDLISRGMSEQFFDDLSFDQLEQMRLVWNWDTVDDTEGNRWYIDENGEVAAAAVIPTDWAGEDFVDSTAIDENLLGVTENS